MRSEQEFLIDILNRLRLRRRTRDPPDFSAFIRVHLRFQNSQAGYALR